MGETLIERIRSRAHLYPDYEGELRKAAKDLEIATTDYHSEPPRTSARLFMKVFLRTRGLWSRVSGEQSF